MYVCENAFFRAKVPRKYNWEDISFPVMAKEQKELDLLFLKIHVIMDKDFCSNKIVCLILLTKKTIQAPWIE